MTAIRHSLLVLGITLVAWSGAVPVQAKTPVVLQLPWHHQFQFAGYYVALDQGFYRDAGLDVEIRGVNQGPQVVDEVLSRRADFGISGSGLLIFRSQGQPVVAVAALFQHSPLIFLALESSGIRTPADLAGRRVMMSPNYTSLEMMALLRQEKLVDRVNILPTSFDYRSLLRGETDVFNAYATNEPFLLESEGHPTVSISPDAHGIRFYRDVLFTHADLVQRDPELVDAFRRASLRGWQEALDNPEAAIRIIQAHYPVDKTFDQLAFEAREVAKAIAPDEAPLGHQDLGRWAQSVHHLIALGEIEPSFSLPDSFVFTPPLGIDWARLRPAIIPVLVVFLALLVFLSILLRVNRNLVQTRGQLTREIHHTAEAASSLRETQRVYRTLMNSLYDAVFLHPLVEGGFGNFCQVNDRALEMYGYSQEQMLSFNARDLVADPENLPLFAGQVSLESGMKLPRQFFDARHVRASGEVFAVEVSRTLLEIEGHPHLMSVVRDVSEKRALEEQQAHLELQVLQAQKLESLGVLAGGIAHDFNNILMVVLGHSDMAMNALEPDHPARGSIVQIHNAAGQAAQLASQMLAYSGKGKFQVEPLNLNDLIRDIEGMLTASVAKKALLRFDLREDLPSVEADGTQLRQVIMNLVINASEALEGQSGTVSVVTGKRECDSEYFLDPWQTDPVPAGEYVFLEVRDSGCGISPEKLGRVFDPFYTTKFTGRGLGMSAVLGIARGHKGAIKIHSRVGQGTVFKFLLPASGHPVAEQVQKESTGMARQHGLVMVVEDEPTVLALSCRMLQDMGFTPIEAEDGLRAVEIYRRRGQDILLTLMDLTMPGLDGREATEAIRMIDPSAKVVVVSGYTQEDSAIVRAVPGLDGFLQKPFSAVDLQQAVHAILGH
jgi:PAS domain S-box-containing protein